jgi:hypothetical protein
VQDISEQASASIRQRPGMEQQYPSTFSGLQHVKRENDPLDTPGMESMDKNPAKYKNKAIKDKYTHADLE